MSGKPEITTLGQWNIPFVDPWNLSKFIEALSSVSPDTVVQMTVSQLIQVLNNLWVETEKSEFSREKFIESIPMIRERFSSIQHSNFLKVFRDKAQVMREDWSFEAVFWNILLLSKEDFKTICLSTQKVKTQSKLWERFFDMFVQILIESWHVFHVYQK